MSHRKVPEMGHRNGSQKWVIAMSHKKVSAMGHRNGSQK